MVVFNNQKYTALDFSALMHEVQVNQTSLLFDSKVILDIEAVLRLEGFIDLTLQAEDWIYLPNNIGCRYEALEMPCDHVRTSCLYAPKISTLRTCKYPGKL